MGSGEKKKKGNKKDGSGHGRKHGERHPMITDERFSAAQSDPRFMEVPKKRSKVEVDSRFDRLFTDRSFASSKASIDKRGKPNNKDKAASSLSHYYRPQQQQEEVTKRTEESEDDDNEGDSDAESLSESDSEKLKTTFEDEEDDERMSVDESSSTDTTDSESGFETEEDNEEDAFAPLVENIPEIDEETRRLAVVNLDWTHVRAVDLFVLLSSFLPKGGQIMSVTVYPTEFGLKRMEEEAVHGPIGLFSDNGNEKENKDGDEDEDDDDEIDNKKIRAYELSKLRYYYAVVECDSIATADYLYKTCDGVEFERSANTLDLRFIPDSMEFKHQPRDVATEAPADYEGLDFQTQALHHSGDVHIAWDEDEPHRSKTFKRLLKSDQPAESELNEVLATDESETDDDDDDVIADVMENNKSQKKRKRQDKYLALIQSGNGSDDDDDEEDNDQDMEVTFNSGLEDISKRILENKDKKSETVWEATLRKKKEKKKALRKRSKYSSDDESDDYDDDDDREIREQADDFFIEDNQVHGIKEEESDKEAEASKAELELLLTDVKGENSNLKGFKLKPKKKGKKGEEDPVEEKLPTIDYSDPRFSALLNNPHYALDPTDPQFKRTAAYARQVVQKETKGDMVNVRKLDHLVNSDEALEGGEVETAKNNILAKTKENHELSSLVRSIKMKSKQMPIQSERKVQRNQKLKKNLQK